MTVMRTIRTTLGLAAALALLSPAVPARADVCEPNANDQCRCFSNRGTLLTPKQNAWYESTPTPLVVSGWWAVPDAPLVILVRDEHGDEWRAHTRSARVAEVKPCGNFGSCPLTAQVYPFWKEIYVGWGPHAIKVQREGNWCTYAKPIRPNCDLTNYCAATEGDEFAGCGIGSKWVLFSVFPYDPGFDD